MKNLIITLAVLLSQVGAKAQPAPHPCDTVPTSLTTAFTGQTFTLGWCHNGKDTSGKDLDGSLSWFVFRDTTRLTNQNITKSSTANAEGLYYYSVTRSEANVGTYTYRVNAYTVVTNPAGAVTLESAVVSFAPIVITSPGVSPSGVVKPRTIKP